MNILKAQKMCMDLMEKHGLQGWKFKWLFSTRTCGRCRTATKEICLNKDYVYLTTDEPVIWNTVIHEESHRLNFIRNGLTGHGPEWKAIFRSLGGNGERLNKSPTTVMPTKSNKKVSNNRPAFAVC